jgi:hypothetical protein
MKCEVCGNDYDKSFTVLLGEERHTFDSFECAIHALAPTCGHCGCHVVGHGVEQDGVIYCCAHCAHESGAEGLSDRLDQVQADAEPTESRVTEASLESFPASDPPAWAGSRQDSAWT